MATITRSIMNSLASQDVQASRQKTGNARNNNSANYSTLLSRFGLSRLNLTSAENLMDYVAGANDDPWLLNQAQRCTNDSPYQTNTIVDISKIIDSTNNTNDPLSELQAIAAAFGGTLNPAFLQEYLSLGGSGFSAGSTDTERSFNPLTKITTTPDGIDVFSLSSFFKIADILNSSLRSYAQGLYASNQWGAYSRAFDDLFTEALRRQGIDPEKDKVGSSQKISTYIAQIAGLINGAIDESGKAIHSDNRALLVSLLASYTQIDEKSAEQLGISKETLGKYMCEGKGILVSDILLENPDILNDPAKADLLKSLIKDQLIKTYDQDFAHLKDSYKGEGTNLGQIEANMISHLTGKYAEDVKKLNDGKAPDANEIKSFMAKYGYKGGEYYKIDNSEIAAQTYLNLKALEHDHKLFKEGKLTDENRMYKALQTFVRSTPYNGADGNGAFNECNWGRKQAAIMGMNRDLLGNFALPFISDEHMMTVLGQMKDLGIKINCIDISHHGCSSGTHGGGGGISIGDKDGLLKAIIERMSDGGEVLYNSCSIGAGTESNSNNLGLTTLRTAIADKGLKVHVADYSTMGYLEDAVIDVLTGNFGLTPRKLDGKVGGYTLVEAGRDKAHDRRDDYGRYTSFLARFFGIRRSENLS